MKPVTVLFTLLFASAAYAQGGGRGPGEQPKPVEQPKCDLARIEKAKYCAPCLALKEKDDLTDGWVCKACTNRVKEVEICTKEHFECPTCKASYPKEGACANKECKAEKLAKKLSKCRVIWKCKGSCLQTADEKKSCPQKECSAKGKEFEKTCELSGRAPHAVKKK